MNGDTGSRGERGVKGVWRGRGQFRELRKQDVREWGAQQAGRRGSEWRTREAGLANPGETGQRRFMGNGLAF